MEITRERSINNLKYNITNENYSVYLEKFSDSSQIVHTYHKYLFHLEKGTTFRKSKKKYMRLAL